MSQILWVDEHLEAWGDWVKQDNGMGYGGMTLGALVRRRAGASNDIACGSDDLPLQVDQVLASMPEDLTSAIKLRYLTGLNSTGAAQRLGVSRRTYFRMIERAHRMLAHSLAGCS